MNILSIDFDWIMEPSIEAYNNLVNTDSLFGPMELWNKIQNIIPNINPECNLDHFNILYFLIKKYSKQLKFEDCYIALSHGDLYDFMEQINDKKYVVYNIDHHHDLGYNIQCNDLDNTVPNLANWAYHANKNLNMYKYVWIHNPNSCMPERIPEKLKYIHTTDLNILNNVKFDKIFICASWEWVPLKYQNLFAILTSLFDDLEKK